MKLSETQIAQVKEWIENGAGVGDVQKNLEKEFGLSMTYMDVRFLIDDIDAQLKDLPKKKSGDDAILGNDSDAAAAKPESASASEDPFADAAAAFNKEEIAGMPQTHDDANVQADSDADAADGKDAENGESKLKVTLDKTPRAGTFASGNVVFSDGAQADWVVDMNGQLGLVPSVVGYSPPQEDIPEFQKELQKLLGVDEASNNAVDDSKIEITLSPIQRPDSLAFGDVTFSDGSKAEWRIDRAGQLVFIPADSNKKPPQEEMPAFQRKLSQMLSKMY